MMMARERERGALPGAFPTSPATLASTALVSCRPPKRRVHSQCLPLCSAARTPHRSIRSAACNPMTACLQELAVLHPHPAKHLQAGRGANLAHLSCTSSRLQTHNCSCTRTGALGSRGSVLASHASSASPRTKHCAGICPFASAAILPSERHSRSHGGRCAYTSPWCTYRSSPRKCGSAPGTPTSPRLPRTSAATRRRSEAWQADRRNCS